MLFCLDRNSFPRPIAFLSGETIKREDGRHARKGPGSSPPIAVRQYFPETWIFGDTVTG